MTRSNAYVSAVSAKETDARASQYSPDGIKVQSGAETETLEFLTFATVCSKGLAFCPINTYSQASQSVNSVALAYL